MKFIHTSDLHLGKRLCETAMLEDQEYILKELVDIAKNEKPDLFIIAGDLYDKAAPPAEAVAVLDKFLTSLTELGIKVAIVSGNHDSPERIAFGRELMQIAGVYISCVYDGSIKFFDLADDEGSVRVWLMPYLRPGMVRQFANEEVQSHDKAVEVALAREEIDFAGRNILVAHQFVTGSLRSDSEAVVVGGIDNVDAALFKSFDYTALGHIHKAQQIQNVRYSGTPIKYSFSEWLNEKSVTVGTLNKKGSLKLKAVPLTPLRDLREIKGSFEEIMKNTSEDYLHICLTDEQEYLDIAGRLRLKYKNLLKISYENSRTLAQGVENYQVEYKDSIVMFDEFYKAQNGVQLSPEQAQYMEEKIKGVQVI